MCACRTFPRAIRRWPISGRFAAGFTPWDARGVPAALTRHIANQRARAGRRVLILGCGSAYEAAALDAAGFDVLAIDYSAEAIAQARHVLAPALADRVLREADFFTFDTAAFDWIYERAFLAALPPALWARWAARLAALLNPGGVLAGFFFIDEQAPSSHPRRGPHLRSRAVNSTPCSRHSTAPRCSKPEVQTRSKRARDVDLPDTDVVIAGPERQIGPGLRALRNEEVRRGP